MLGTSIKIMRALLRSDISHIGASVPDQKVSSHVPSNALSRSFLFRALLFTVTFTCATAHENESLLPVDRINNTVAVESNHLDSEQLFSLVATFIYGSSLLLLLIFLLCTSRSSVTRLLGIENAHNNNIERNNIERIDLAEVPQDPADILIVNPIPPTNADERCDESIPVADPNDISVATMESVRFRNN